MKLSFHVDFVLDTKSCVIDSFTSWSFDRRMLTVSSTTMGAHGSPQVS